MKLLDLVVHDAIITDLESTNRDDALGELVDALVKAGTVSPDLRDEYLAEIIEREERGSTGFGHGVAVPHVKHTAITKMVAAVGISARGVEFHALDRQPVYSVVLLLSPKDEADRHIDAMQAIFDALGRDTFRRFLRQANSVDDVLVLLEEFDSKPSMR